MESKFSSAYDDPFFFFCKVLDVRSDLESFDGGHIMPWPVNVVDAKKCNATMNTRHTDVAYNLKPLDYLEESQLRPHSNLNHSQNEIEIISPCCGVTSTVNNIRPQRTTPATLRPRIRNDEDHLRCNDDAQPEWRSEDR